MKPNPVHLRCGPRVRLELLPTPHRCDAVALDYKAVDDLDGDLHPTVCAPSRAHISPVGRNDNKLELGMLGARKYGSEKICFAQRMLGSEIRLTEFSSSIA